MDHTFGYHCKKFTYACTESSAHAHGSEIRNGHFKLFKTSMGCTRMMPGSDPRAATFHQMQVTVGDTPCSVKGV